jgi:RimJ/RimL family protein N-acetyltransferase
MDFIPRFFRKLWIFIRREKFRGELAEEMAFHREQTEKDFQTHANVVEEKRGRGIADGMMAKIGTWFVEQNAVRVCVNVDPRNTAARKLYARCGAQPLNDLWMIWEDARAMSTGVDK